MKKPGNWLDRAIGTFAPTIALKRVRARQMMAGPRAEYDGASLSRRTENWRRNSLSARSELNPAVVTALRSIARDLVNNNPFAANSVAAIAANVVGTGITFQVYRGDKVDLELTKLAREHFDTTACDAEGRHDLYGLQLQAAKSIVTCGAILARRRWRRPKDKLPVPFQVQMLEPDYVNMQARVVVNDSSVVDGIAFDAIGRRKFYYLYSGHPGSPSLASLKTSAVPASDIAHCYRADRPEQHHGASWFAPVIVRIKDFGEYEDAQLVRQKIAACFTAFRIGSVEADPIPDVDSNGNPIELAPNATQVEPGMIETLPAGETMEFADPPGVDGYAPYSKVSLQAISAGLSLPYEVVTGDLSNVSFISGRIGRLQFKRQVEVWQWSMIIPQLCQPIGEWFLEAADAKGIDVAGAYFKWTPPTFEMMSPETEVPAIRDAIRSGQMTISEAARRRGEDPDVFLAEWAADARRLDDLKLIFDSDPRKVTAVGNAVQITPDQMNAKPSGG